MKVIDLLNVLKNLDPETLVVVDGYEGDYNTPRGAKQIHVTYNKSEWYYGDYKDCPEDTPNAVKSIYLMR